MTELPSEPSVWNAEVTTLYVRKISRLSFQPTGALREAFVGMYDTSIRHQAGQRALFLFSEPQQEVFRPKSEENKKSEQLDSALKRRLGALGAQKQFGVAKWIEAVRDSAIPRTGFRLNVLLDPDTQTQLHANVHQGLDQSLFGRKAITATLWIPDHDIAATAQERSRASREIKRVLWGDDPFDTQPSLLHSPDRNGAKVTHIDWTSRISDARIIDQ